MISFKGLTAHHERAVISSRTTLRLVAHEITARVSLQNCIVLTESDDVKAKEDHQAVHQDPEDGEWHRLAHDITILTLHIAGGGSDGYRLW